MTRTVILGIDDSEFSEYAFDFYTKSVLLKGDIIILVHVSEFASLAVAPAILTDPMVVSQLIKEEDAKVKELVKKYSHKMKELHLGGTVKQMAGKVGEAIVAVAKDEGAGLIVMGTRGAGRLRRTLIGSTTDYVLHHAHAPVLVCHKPSEPQGAR